MSFIVNPLGYRLTKTKFCKYNWVNLNKYNYKKNFFEDKILDNFFLWFKFFLNWINFSILIFNFNILKFNKFLQINIKLIIRKKIENNKKKRKKKKNIINYFLIKNNFSFFFKFFTFLKKNVYKKKKKNKIIFIKKKKKKIKIFKNFYYNYFFKIKNFIFLLFFSKFIKNNLNFFNLNKLFFLNYFYKKNNKKQFKKYFLFFIKSFLLFLLNNIFFNKKIILNFLNQKEFFNSANNLSCFIKMRVFQKYKVLHIVNLLFNNLIKKKSIVGIEMGLFGRYQKKLRNRKVWKLKGIISPSNINSPISYKNFVVLLRYGICGVKLYLLTKVYKNEIF